MKNIKVIFEDGNYLYTKINDTSKQQIEKYYIGNLFHAWNSTDLNEIFVKCVSVAFLD